MPALTTTIKQQANAGDIYALLSVYDFCKGQNISNHQTFASVLDIVFHNLRPELQPNLENVSHFPRASRPWLKTAAISICILLESLDSLLAATDTDSLPGEEKFLQTVPLVSCRKMSSHWEHHIWPAISALTYWYILDDLQPPIAAYIHQDTLHTAIAKLFMYLTQQRFNMLSQIQQTPGVALCAMRLFIRSVAQYPHPSGLWTFYQREAMEDSENTVVKQLGNYGFIPAFLSFLTRIGTRLTDRNHESPMVLSIASRVFEYPPKVVADIATQYPELLNELIRTWEKHRALHHPIPYQASATDEADFIMRQTFIMDISGLVRALMAYGGWESHRQGLKRKVLRALVQPVLPGYDSPKISSATDEFIQSLERMLAGLSLALCQYSIFTMAAHEVQVIENEGLDAVLMNSNAAELEKLKVAWAHIKLAVEVRLPLLEQYKRNAFRGGPFCNMKSLCPRDVQGGSYKCSVCKASYYCSRRCQKKHWELSHKKSCKPYHEEFQPDQRDMDYLEYQLSQDFRYSWRDIPLFNPSNTPLSSISYVLCNYNMVPPKVVVEPEMYKTIADAVRADAGEESGPEFVMLLIMVPDVHSRTMIPYSRVHRSLFLAALTPEGSELKKDRRMRLMHIRGHYHGEK